MKRTNWTAFITSSSHLSGDAFLRTGYADLCLNRARTPVMVVNMMRGGMASVYAKRHIKCNNNYLENKDPSQEETHCVLIGASNFYVGIMEK